MEEEKKIIIRDKFISITDNNSIQKQLTEEGEGVTPTEIHEVCILFVSQKLSESENTTEEEQKETQPEDKKSRIIDSSQDAEFPFSFFIGKGCELRSLKGIDDCVKTMKQGESALFILEGEYGYGEQGAKANIPIGTPILLSIELLAFHEREKLIYDYSEEERFTQAKAIKQEANTFFSKKNYKAAKMLYRKSMTFIDSVYHEDCLEEIKAFKSTLFLNLSVCMNQTSCFQTTLKYTSQILSKESTLPKPFYLRGMAHMHLKNYTEAISDLSTASSLCPSDPKIKAELARAKSLQLHLDNKEKAKFKKIFAPGGLYCEKQTHISVTLHSIPPYDSSNLKVYFDIQHKEDSVNRVIFELFQQKVPKTCENFRCLCTGEKSTAFKAYTYKNSVIHKIIPGFILQGGDLDKGDGTGGYSVYGECFEDENFLIPHSHGGILSMANKGEEKPNTNGSQFFITYKGAPWCNGKNVAFGRVVVGMKYLRSLQKIDIYSETKIPRYPVRIVKCGEFKGEIKEEDIQYVNRKFAAPGKISNVKPK
jgi:peptidylprolyl isomerase